MTHFLKEEFSALGQFFKTYSRETIIIVSATLFITLANYHPIGSEWLSTFLYYGFFPILVIIIVLRKNPLDFGLRRGNPRIWGFYTVVFCVVAAVILYLSSFDASLKAYYLQNKFNFSSYFLTTVISLAASEFMYRGFLIFGLKDKFKEGSILLQMIPFALLHLGKPEIETVSTIITGILFGYVVYRGKSYWPAFIIHMLLIYFLSA
jgi:uncharacterized protein